MNFFSCFDKENFAFLLLYSIKIVSLHRFSTKIKRIRLFYLVKLSKKGESEAKFLLEQEKSLYNIY